MITVFKRLSEGDAKISQQFAAADLFWKEFFADKHDWQVSDLAEQLTFRQHAYEGCFDGNRVLAKEVMALTALCAIYDEVDGWADMRAFGVRVARAFLASKTSVEVKTYARDAIHLFGLDTEDELRHAMSRRAH